MTQFGPRSSDELSQLLGRPADHAALDESQASPITRARTGFERGDTVFQLELDLMSQRPVVIPLHSASTEKSTTDPSEIINAICREGWELINGSFVFVHEGSKSREKLLRSGEQVAVQGRTVGYYLFRRGAGDSHGASER
jgi:hypothetical protein